MFFLIIYYTIYLKISNLFFNYKYLNNKNLKIK